MPVGLSGAIGAEIKPRELESTFSGTPARPVRLPARQPIDEHRKKARYRRLGRVSSKPAFRPVAAFCLRFGDFWSLGKGEIFASNRITLFTAADVGCRPKAAACR